MIILNDALVKMIYDVAEKKGKSIQSVCEMIVKHLQKKHFTTETAKQLLSDIKKYKAGNRILVGKQSEMSYVSKNGIRKKPRKLQSRLMKPVIAN